MSTPAEMLRDGLSFGMPHAVERRQGYINDYLDTGLDGIDLAAANPIAHDLIGGGR